PRPAAALPSRPARPEPAAGPASAEVAAAPALTPPRAAGRRPAAPAPPAAPAAPAGPAVSGPPAGPAVPVPPGPAARPGRPAGAGGRRGAGEPGADSVILTERPAAGVPPPWRPEELTPDQVRTAVRTIGQCRLAEGRSVFGAYGDTGLTPAMREIEHGLAEGELVPDTAMHALKSLERFQAKLARLIAEEPAASTDDLARQVHDAIRYTFWYGHAAYARGVLATVSRLAELGYEL